MILIGGIIKFIYGCIFSLILIILIYILLTKELSLFDLLSEADIIDFNTIYKDKLNTDVMEMIDYISNCSQIVSSG